MGQCQNRPEVMAARNTSYEWYTKSSAYLSEKYNAASEYMGPKLL